jgi:hypothetical protein
MKFSPLLIRPPFRILAAAVGLAMIFGGSALLIGGVSWLSEREWGMGVAFLLTSPIAVVGVLMLFIAATGRVPSWAAGLTGDEIDERAAGAEVRDD